MTNKRLEQTKVNPFPYKEVGYCLVVTGKLAVIKMRPASLR